MKPIFSKGPAGKPVLITFIVISLILLALAHYTKQLDRVKNTLSFITHPILLAADSPKRAYDWVTETFSSRTSLQKENEQLKTEALTLKAKLQKFESIEQENIRLQGLLGSSFKLGEQFIAASIIRTNLNALSHQVVIDKGSRFNILKGQAAINDNGIVGQVIHVQPLNSTIILITDPNHAIPVEINRTGLRTIATGSGESNVLNLPHLPHNADVQLNDLLVTSGMGGLYPKGYPVARISELTPAPGEAFMLTKAKTVANIDNSRELLLVWSQQQPLPILSNVEAMPTTQDTPNNK